MSKGIALLMAFIVAVAILAGVITLFSVGNNGDAVPQVSAAPPQTKTYYVGDYLFQKTDVQGYYNSYYFHGFEGSAYPYNILLIGSFHAAYNKGGMANLKIVVNKGQTIHIVDSSFEVVDYGYDWVTLKELT